MCTLSPVWANVKSQVLYTQPDGTKILITELKTPTRVLDYIHYAASQSIFIRVKKKINGGDFQFTGKIDRYRVE
jgi:hypothetical protein